MNDGEKRVRTGRVRATAARTHTTAVAAVRVGSLFMLPTPRASHHLALRSWSVARATAFLSAHARGGGGGGGRGAAPAPLSCIAAPRQPRSLQPSRRAASLAPAAAAAAAAAMAPPPADRTMLWFRKGLRLHDNPALLDAAAGATALFPVFCLDPHFLRPQAVGVNRLAFLFEALADLDASLRARGSRLIVLRGDPVVELPKAWAAWRVGRLAFEEDTEPYARSRDAAVRTAAAGVGVAVSAHASHTLWDPDAVAAAIKQGGGAWPPTYQSFNKAARGVAPPAAPAPASR